MPYLRHCGDFVPKIGAFESKMVYTTHGKCSVYYAPRVNIFFREKFSCAESYAEGWQNYNK